MQDTPVLENTRDVRMMERLLKHPDWVMPDNVYGWLPKEMAAVIQDKKADGSPRCAETARVRAAQVLMKMSQQNRDADPTPQQINVSVTTDVAAAMEAIKSLPREELERLSQAAEIIGKIRGSSPASA